MNPVLDYPLLQRDFYANEDCAQVAQALLGKTLVVYQADSHQVKAGRIVETEAYLGPGDLAAHSARGPTPRTQAMFGEPGHAYVYLIYGMHHCLNTVTGPVGSGTGVLLRALEPVYNLDGQNTSGPGRLCKALGVDRNDYGTDLCTGERIYVLDSPLRAAEQIQSSPRIGVQSAGEGWAEAPLRFFIAGNKHVSKPR